MEENSFPQLTLRSPVLISRRYQGYCERVDKVIVKAELGTPVFGDTQDQFSHALGFNLDVAIVDAE